MSFHSTAALHSAATAAGDTTPLGSIKRLRIRESQRTAGDAISASEDGRLRRTNAAILLDAFHELARGGETRSVY